MTEVEKRVFPTIFFSFQKVRKKSKLCREEKACEVQKWTTSCDT